MCTVLAREVSGEGGVKRIVRSQPAGARTGASSCTHVVHARRRSSSLKIPLARRSAANFPFPAPMADYRGTVLHVLPGR
jgi:hypothetical protein